VQNVASEHPDQDLHKRNRQAHADRDEAGEEGETDPYSGYGVDVVEGLQIDAEDA